MTINTALEGEAVEEVIDSRYLGTSQTRLNGDEIPEVGTGNFRVIYNNCNGLQPNEFVKEKMKQKRNKTKDKVLDESLQFTKAKGIFGALRKWNAGIVCVSETQTSWENKLCRELMAQELRRVDQYGKITSSSSDALSASLVKPGGTAIISDGGWSSKLIDQGRDPSGLGRWSFITIVGKQDTKLTVICAYRVCKGQNINNVGPTTAYAQQYGLLKKAGKKSPNPRKQFITDLKGFILEKRAERHEILLCMDGNEELNEKNSQIKALINSCGMYDIASSKVSPVPPTFIKRGVESTIDFMVGTQMVVDSIIRFGMMPEWVGDSLGDHQAMYIDIDMKSLLSLKPMDIVSPTTRALRSCDVKGVEKYLEKVNEGFVIHKVHKRLEELREELAGQDTLTTYQQRLFDGIDQDVFRICRHAEKSLQKHSCGRYMWSPALDAANAQFTYWKMRREAYGDVSKTGELLLKSDSLDIEDYVDKSMSAIIDHSHECERRLRQVQAKDKEYRVQYLLQMADKYSMENDISRETAIRELLCHEEVRDTFRTIRHYMGAPRSPQMTEVWINEGTHSKIVLDDSESVEQHLLARNKEKLFDANNTPFAGGGLSSYLGEHGNSDFATRALLGSPLPEIEDVDPVIKDYILGLQYDKATIPDSVDVSMTVDQYKAFWKKKRENTVTSPFGLHVGHYKASIADESILEVHMLLMMIPFMYSYPPKRWRKTVQVMLEKCPGTPWSHRLRIIELFDSQMNAAMQIFLGKRMVHNAVNEDLVNPAVFGSVPGKNAQDALLEKKLLFDNLRVTRKQGAIFDCDAKGCYDRIIPKFSTLHTQRLGLPTTWAMFFSIYWKKCQHHVRTKYGISTESFSCKDDEQLYGIGQGNGAGPAIWMSHINVMFNVLEKLCTGIKLTSPDGTNTFSSVGTSFVDDSTLGATAPNESMDEKRSEGELVRHINNLATKWEKLLFTNGGRLELSKCFWILVTWKWTRGTPAMATIDESPHHLSISQSEDTQEVMITRKEVTAAPKVLGCTMAANGDWTNEVGR